jgi:hypothetical protein
MGTLTQRLGPISAMLFIVLTRPLFSEFVSLAGKLYSSDVLPWTKSPMISQDHRQFKAPFATALTLIHCISCDMGRSVTHLLGVPLTVAHVQEVFGSLFGLWWNVQDGLGSNMGPAMADLVKQMATVSCAPIVVLTGH